jgi:hypothetical protein
LYGWIAFIEDFMSLPCPYELKKSRDIIPVDRLLRWAETAGFITRAPRGGSSHIKCTHEKYPDIGFVLAKTTTKLDNKRHLANALIEIRKREEAKNCRSSFEVETQDKVKAISSKLPAYIEAEHDYQTGQTVLRDRQIPQIGVTIKAGEERLLENKIRYIESLKRDAFILLNRALFSYDIDVGLMRHGNFEGKISHAIYDLPEQTLPPYKAGGDPMALFADLQSYIEQVIEKDLCHVQRLESVLKQPFAGPVFVGFSARRGERTNVVTLEKPNGSDFRLTFETASNRRANPGDVHGGRITERELERIESVLGGLAAAHARQDAAPLAMALRA